MLENEDERQEVDGRSHAERLIVPFLCALLRSPELRPTDPVVVPKFLPRSRPQPHHRSTALRCLRQSCGQLPRLLDKGCHLIGALSHTSTRCASTATTPAVTPAVVVVVATPTVLPLSRRLGAPWSRPSLCRCLPRLRFANSSAGARPEDEVGGLVVGHQQGLDEGQRSRPPSSVRHRGRKIHASPGRFH